VDSEISKMIIWYLIGYAIKNKKQANMTKQWIYDSFQWEIVIEIGIYISTFCAYALIILYKFLLPHFCRAFNKTGFFSVSTLRQQPKRESVTDRRVVKTGFCQRDFGQIDEQKR
jgi:hypothetical protein